MPSQISYPLLRQPLVDAQGYLARPWQQFFQAFFVRMGADQAMTNLELEDETSTNAASAAANAAAIAANSADDAAQRILQAFVPTPMGVPSTAPPFVVQQPARQDRDLPLWSSEGGLARNLFARVAALEASDAGSLTVGSWTPTLAGSTTPGSHTYSVQVGRYVQLGAFVYASAAITLSALDGAAAGNALITGLPVTSRNVSSLVHAWVPVRYSAVNLDAGYTQLTGRLQPNSTQIDLLEDGDNIGAGSVAMTQLASTTVLDGTICYLA